MFATRLLALLCRGCGRSSEDVRFARKHECIDCAQGRKEARAERIAARGPRVCEPVRLPDPGDNPKHLAWIRMLPCACNGPLCSKIMHAHHVRSAKTAGTGEKPPDSDTVPLCSTHHDEGHRTGWATFEAKYGVDLPVLAYRLARLSPHLKRPTT